MPEKIQEFTSANRDQIQVVHQIFYDMALETETNEVCIKNAEVAVSKLVGSALKPGYKMFWVGSPEQGEEMYQELMKSLFSTLSFLLTESLYEDMKSAFKVEVVELIRESKKTMFCDTVYQRVSKECYNEGYHITLELTRDLIQVRDQDKFGSRAAFNLTDDLPWAAEYSYWARTLGGSFGTDLALWITAVHDFFEAAHALWVLPGAVVICRKPDGVTTDEDGKIIAMHWGPIASSASAPTANYEDPRPHNL